LAGAARVFLLRFEPAGQIELGTALGEIEFDLVDVAPAPIFAGFDGPHDRVLCGAEMFRGVFILPRIAAADFAANGAEAQMNPSVAHLDALGADMSARLRDLDLLRVRTT